LTEPIINLLSVLCQGDNSRINRLSAGRLYEIARALNAPIVYFYKGLGEEAPQPAPSRERMLFEMVRNFSDIPNKKHQQAISELARALAGR
jgi:transcriptional regulator with XRE-family HTH domain